MLLKAFPRGVLGPVDFLAFSLFALSFFSEIAITLPIPDRRVASATSDVGSKLVFCDRANFPAIEMLKGSFGSLRSIYTPTAWLENKKRKCGAQLRPVETS